MTTEFFRKYIDIITEQQELLPENDGPADPGRRGFLKKAAGVAAMAAAPQQTLRGLGQSAAAAVPGAAGAAMPAATATILDRLFDYTVAFRNPIRWEYDSDAEEEDDDTLQQQGKEGAMPWGESYEVHRTPKGRYYLHTSEKGGEGGILTYMQSPQSQPMSFLYARDFTAGTPSEIEESDQDIKDIYDQWLESHDYDPDDDDWADLVDRIIDRDPQSHGRSPSDHSTAPASGTVRSATQDLAKGAVSDVAKTAAGSVARGQGMAAGGGGLAAFKELVNRVMSRAREPQQMPAKDMGRIKPTSSLPALPAPDRSATELMRDLQNIMDRPLTAAEQDVVKQEVGIKKPEA